MTLGTSGATAAPPQPGPEAGYRESPTTNTIQAIINQSLLDGQKDIKIPEGKYYVEPTEENLQTHLLLENLQDVTIDATNVELIWYV
jgi:hypothetical protein